MTRGGFLGVGAALRSADACAHPFADAPISAVDVRDVAACAAALLAVDAPDDRVGVRYDVTGPAAVRLGAELARALSELHSRPVSIAACGVDEFLAARGLPPAAAANLAGFLAVLQTRCAETTDVVAELTGRPAIDIGQHVRDYSADLSATPPPP